MPHGIFQQGADHSFARTELLAQDGDLGQIVELCLKKDGLGFQVFNAGNDDNGAIISSKELADRFFPGVPITRELSEHEALFSNRKIREVLGFKEQHNWQKYLKWE